MTRQLSSGVLVVVIAMLAAPAARGEGPPPIQVMIVGTYHFGNPGHDLHNTNADDVTTPRRQKELAELAALLERFKPTRVAVEASVDAADLQDAAYHAFTPADLGKKRNETVQIGYRIAHDAGLAEVYGIDESTDGIDYFPYPKVVDYAKQHGGEPRLAALNAKIEKSIREFSASQTKRSIAQLLAQKNDPAQIRAEHDEFYYALLALGDARAQPGAELNAAWYQRNAKIFAKLTQIARPGDRVIVVFGAGHLFWLRHFVEHTPGFVLVEPNRYLSGK
jgi:uncharacterized protein DUF5694